MEILLNKNFNNTNRDNKPDPFFSVIITTYNRAMLVKRALRSLIIQTESDWEGIVVDDDSTDDTYDQILPILTSFPKIRYIKQSHNGEAASKNAGMLAASGRYITFLDSDDEFERTHLESRKAILIQNPSTKFLYGGARIIGNQFVPDRFNSSRKINLNECVIGGTFFIDRNIAIGLNGFRYILLGADADLFDRAKSNQVPMMEVPDSTYIYHHETEDSITNTMFRSA